MNWLFIGGQGWIGNRMVLEVKKQFPDDNIHYYAGYIRNVNDQEVLMDRMKTLRINRVVDASGKTFGPGCNSIDYLKGKLMLMILIIYLMPNQKNFGIILMVRLTVLVEMYKKNMMQTQIHLKDHYMEMLMIFIMKIHLFHHLNYFLIKKLHYSQKLMLLIIVYHHLCINILL